MTIAVFFVLSGCAPSHTVRLLPDFVDAALAPGDRVVVITKSGVRHDFIVVALPGNSVNGAQISVPLPDIASLKKISWQRPAQACGGDRPVGCSMPLLVSLISDAHSAYQEIFHDACVQHDFCYRHGFRSYGHLRAECDEAFLDDMRTMCPPPPQSLAAKIFSIGLIESRVNCLSMAEEIYSAVRHYGEEHFQKDASTYCEYDGPPKPSSVSALNQAGPTISQ
ncbi:MAG: hypothetical protein AB8B96_01670 [Lysobacterales bacterium]